MLSAEHKGKGANYFVSRAGIRTGLPTSHILEKDLELKMIQIAFRLIKAIQGLKGAAKKVAPITQLMRMLNSNSKALMNFTMHLALAQKDVQLIELTLWGITSRAMSDGQLCLNRQPTVCRRIIG
jgi:hypothetical protein